MPHPLASCREPSLAEKVAFLRRPEHYPGGPTAIDVVETHNSWVFLAGALVFKLKKPVRSALLDLSTREARRLNCEREIELNRRLAPDVYLGIVALTVDRGREICLGGAGVAVDWLVKMRRLPSERMLDAALRSGSASDADLKRLCRLLTAFYRGSTAIAVDPLRHRQRFAADIRANRAELSAPLYALPATQVARVCAAQAAFVTRCGDLIEQRARDARIIEAHGDLRPEHICLTPEPLIIDCLEFRREFRLLDPVDELAYLALECERLGFAHAGARILGCYLDTAPDAVPAQLIAFYKSFRAGVRARIAALHIADREVPNPEKWRRRVIEYIEISAKYANHGCPAVCDISSRT